MRRASSTCRCSAYRFPHREYGGRCSGGPYFDSIDDVPAGRSRHRGADDEHLAADNRERHRDFEASRVRGI